MESTIDMHAGQYRAGGADRAYQNNFSRLPWERIELREPGRPPVTLWVGALRVIAAVETPGIGPDDVAVSVQGSSLALRGTGPIGLSLDVPLPCAVERSPVLVAGGRGILYAILVKKQAPDPAMAA
jgi:HSP20 family molecular chaperone IbpA